MAERMSIALVKKPGMGWMARFSDPVVRELFGTDTLPTGYTDRANAETVLAGIASKNPDCIVTFAKE
jgi:hypothetical protein